MAEDGQKRLIIRSLTRRAKAKKCSEEDLEEVEHAQY